MTEIITKLVVDCSTGETKEIPLSPKELEQRELDRVASAQAEAERKAAEEAREAAKASAQAKLEALGLTAEEIAVLKS
jgi:hypothetical protein